MTVHPFGSARLVRHTRQVEVDLRGGVVVSNPFQGAVKSLLRLLRLAGQQVTHAGRGVNARLV